MEEKVVKYYNDEVKTQYKELVEYFLGKKDHTEKFTNEGLVLKDKGYLKVITKPGDTPNSPVFQMCAPSLKILTDKEINDISMGKIPIHLFTHTDLDGQMSGAVVRTYFNLPALVDNFTIVKYNYSGPAIYDALNDLYSRNGIAIITDLNLNPKLLTKIIYSFNKIIWIDHHLNSLMNMRSIIDNWYPDSKKDIAFILDTRYSATMIAFLFLANLTSNHEWNHKYIVNNENIPESVILTSIYDTHNLESPDDYTKSSYLNQFYWDNVNNMQMEFDIYKLILDNAGNDTVDRMIKTGEELFAINQKKLVKIYENTAIYSAEADGIIYKGMVGNGNLLLMSPDKDYNSHCNILIKFNNQTDFKVSVYSTNSKISEINLTKIIVNRLNGHRLASGMNDTYYSYQGLVADIYKDRDIKEDLEVKIDHPEFADERIKFIFGTLATIIHHAWKTKRAV